MRALGIADFFSLKDERGAVKAGVGRVTNYLVIVVTNLLVIMRAVTCCNSWDVVVHGLF